MVIVSSKPIGKEGEFGMERMGDPMPVPGNEPYVCLLFPYPQSGAPTYASWKAGDSNWSFSTTLGSDEHFQISTKLPVEGGQHVLEAERAGVVSWLLVGGLV